MTKETPMKTRIALPIAAAALALSAGALAQSSPERGENPNYVAQITPKYESFAGSQENLQSLATGLRNGTEITLTGGGTKTTFDVPTRPMGYGNVTRSLDLASRQLASYGITDPTPSEIQAALVGGTITTANGPVTLDGVLTLRSQGMGWGKIAHTIGVFPSGNASATGASNARSFVSTPLGTTTGGAAASGITTAAGGRVTGQGNAYGRDDAPGVQTAAGASAGASTAAGGKGRALGRAK